MENPKVMIRADGQNPPHHLWLNNGTWWIHYTVHMPDYTKKRVRQSLRTKCVETARLRRDELFRRLTGGSCSRPTALPLAA